jgi:hypothetical protein
MSETKGLYQVPDEPDDAPQGSVSAPVSAMGKADAPLLPCPWCGQEATLQAPDEENDEYYVECGNWRNCHYFERPTKTSAAAIAAWNRRDGEAARVAEAVAQERARIVAALEGDKLTPGETYKEDREHELYNDAIDDAIAIVRGSKQEDAP